MNYQPPLCLQKPSWVKGGLESSFLVFSLSFLSFMQRIGTCPVFSDIPYFQVKVISLQICFSVSILNEWVIMKSRHGLFFNLLIRTLELCLTWQLGGTKAVTAPLGNTGHRGVCDLNESILFEFDSLSFTWMFWPFGPAVWGENEFKNLVIFDDWWYLNKWKY